MGKSEKRIGRRPGGQPGNQNALKYGRHTARAKAERRWMRDLVEQSAAHLRVMGASAEKVRATAMERMAPE